jgi:hypothetical protein
MRSSYAISFLFCSHCVLQALLHTIKEWPREIYDIAAVIVAVRAELDTVASTSSTISSSSGSSNPSVILMECLAEL